MRSKKSEVKNKGKGIQFDGVELGSATCTHPGLLSKNTPETTEIISPAVMHGMQLIP
jgi:hypothetical protein